MEHPTREMTLDLIASRERMEDELKTLMEVLKSNNVDLTESLIDQEGFPRSDIDVFQVRTARHRIICLKNDLKGMTKQIEDSLHNLHQQQREGLGLLNNISSLLTEFDEGTIPFAKIGAVTDGSPADKAGLKCEDLILGFGSLRSSSFQNLQDVARIVQHSINRDISLCVRRSDKIVPLKLVPKPWTGQGLLGCVILPCDNVDR